ncbi:uncharacterized protein LOC142585835 isoform X1 [Dermacentor variabilis]|uniref:uncharacterized protein LOC142585835 isoform X1 n=1 Tax=Dermacentor variabilis TaxID=34621 RepID=UPI003F5C15CF
MGQKIVFGVLIEDWSAPLQTVATHLTSIAEHVDYMFLQTHYEKEGERCRVALPSVYAATNNRTGTVPISLVMNWIDAMQANRSKQATMCFSISMAALLYRSHKDYSAPCDDVSAVNYMQICEQPPWPAVVGSTGQASLAYMGSQGEQIESHETADLLAVKVSRAVSHLPGACVAAFDVDRDDYEGVCGEPFARLRAVRQAQQADKSRAGQGRSLSEEKERDEEAEPAKRCMPRGKEHERPLVCVLSERTENARTVTTSYCTHVVFSLRQFGSADLTVLPNGYLAQLQESGVRVLVAVHERLLQLSSLRESAEDTARQLRERKLDGLALLYVSRSTRQLPSLERKMKELHDVYQNNGLCVLLSLQVVDYDKPTAYTGALLNSLNKYVDFLVVNTHYSGDYGPCRATPASTFNQPLSTCIPQVPVNRALEWMHNVTGGSPYICFSVDMRAFAYHMYGPMVMDQVCYSEEHLHYEQVCSKDEWIYKQDDYTMTSLGQLSNILHSFETPSSLMNKVVAASLNVPSICVAAFNYDYEDSTGRCHGTPYARMKALRQWLDESKTAKKGMARIPKGFTESSETEGGTTTTSSSLEDYPSERPLVCVISKNVEHEAAVPQGYCTHLVFSGALFNQATQTIVVPRGTWRWRKLRRDMALFLGFDDNSLIRHLIKYGSKAGLDFGTLAAQVLREQGFNGLALLNVNRTSRSIAKLSDALAVIHELFGNDLQVVVSLDIVDVAAPPTLMAVRLRDIFRFSHLVVFQTHYRQSLGYCEVALTSTFDIPNHSPTVPVDTALRWLGQMGTGKQACFSVNLAIIEFSATGDSYLCQQKNILNYAKACDTKNWVEVRQPRGALCTLRQKGKLWQAYETEDQLSAKVSKAFDRNTGACIALFNVDYENYNSACFQKFGRMTSVVQNYLSYQHQRPRPLKRSGLVKLPFNRTQSLKNSHPELIKKAAVPGPRLPRGNLMSLRVPTSSRPLLCVLSEEWANIADVPELYCSHFVIDVAHLNFKTGLTKDPITLLKEKFGKRRQYLVKVSKIPLRNVTQYAQELSASISKLQLNGIAVLNQHIASPLLSLFNERLQLFRRSLRNDLTLVLGLEIPDFDEKPGEVANRLVPLTRTADIIILQTHFRRLWKFCRTAYPSIVQESNNTCQQSVPMLNALKWAKLVETNKHVCLSVNLATLRFHYVDIPGSDLPCTKSREIATYCESGTWNESTDAQFSMSAHRYNDGQWDAFEEELLIKAKVEKIEAARPKSCWAVFNIDYDRDTAACSVHKERFARLKSLGKAAGYNPDWKDSNQTDKDSSARGRISTAPYNRTQAGGSLLCVFSGAISEGLLPPEGLCTAAIYTSVSYDEVKKALVVKDGDSLQHFSTLARHLRLVGAGVAPGALMANMARDFALESTAWLRVKGFNTLAILTDHWPRPDMLNIFRELRKVIKMTEEFGKVSIILGIPPQQKINDLLFLQKEPVDMVIFMGHYQPGSEPCRVMHPSSLSKTTSTLSSLVETTQVIKTLSSKLNITTAVCISVNLAVLTFTLGSTTKFKLGTQCLQETVSSYAEVCPSQSDPDIFYDSALSCYKQNSTHVQTFENEGTLEMKVEFLKKHIPTPCVAAFHTEYEDTEVVCPNRVAFSRIAALRERLDAPLGHESSNRTRSANTSMPAIPGPSETLICVFSERTVEPISLPYGLCTHIIYTGLNYVPESKQIVPLNEYAFKGFLELRKHARLLAAVPSDTVSDLTNTPDVESFSNVISSWLMKNDLMGLALFSTLNTNFEQVHTVTKVLRWQFMNLKLKHLQLIFGAPIHVITPTLIRVADIVNYLVFIHHDPVHQSCRLETMLTNQLGKRELVETINLAKKMTLEVPSATLCLSLSLAVVNTPMTPRGQQELVPCGNKTLSTYDKVCSMNQTATIVGKDFAGMYQQSDNATLYFENEESLLEKVYAAKKLYPLKCIATFYTDYEDVKGHCKTKSPFSRLKQISRALGYHATREEAVPAVEARNGTSNASRSLVCVITDNYPDFDKFPVEYCDYLLYFDPNVRIRRNSFRDFMGGTFETFLHYKSRPNLQAVIGFLVTNDTWKLLLSDSISYAANLGAWLQEKGLGSLAFLMPDVTDAITEHLLVFANLFKKNYPDLKLVLASPVTEKPTALLPFVEVVDMLIFMTHRKSPESPCRITLPSTRSILQDENNDLAASALFMQAFGDKKHQPMMCFSLNFATLKFVVKGNRTEFGAPCEKETWVNYYETCPRSGIFEGFFTGFKTMVQFSDKTVWTYEDEHTVSWKLLSYLQSNPMTCVAAFNLDYEDRRGVCRQPYSRLARLSNALDELRTEESYKVSQTKDMLVKPATSEISTKPGDFTAKRELVATTAVPNKESAASTDRTAVISPADRGHIGIPNTSGSLVCILSAAPEGFPYDLCTHLIFKDISYDSNKNIIKAVKATELLAFLRVARKSSATMAILVNAAESGLMEPSHANVVKRFAQSLSIWLHERAVQGAALFSSLYADIKAYDYVVLTVWRHFQARASSRLKLIAGIYFEHFKSASSLQSLSRNSDLLLLLTHRITEPDTCNVEYPLLFYFTRNDYKFMKSVCDKARCSICLSLNLAVTTSAVIHNKFRFGDVCRQHTIEGYDQTCLVSGHVERDLDWDIALRKNASHLQAFEDDTSLTHRVTSFFNVHPTSCVAAFQADLEDLSGKCPGQPKYSRLLTLAKLVGRDTETLLGKTHSRGRSGGKTLTLEKRPFICVFRKQHISAEFPKNLCTHLLYLSVTYDMYKKKLYEGKWHGSSEYEYGHVFFFLFFLTFVLQLLCKGSYSIAIIVIVCFRSSRQYCR